MNNESEPLDGLARLSDEAAPMRRRAYAVTATLMLVNIVVFFAIESRAFGDPLTIKRGLALIPRVLFGEAELRIAHVAPALTLVTSMFVHSGYVHLFGNMAFLFIFGSAVEAAMDSFFFLLFYISCGVAGGLAYAYSEPTSVTPYIGASGAISGVCAAYVLLFAREALADWRAFLISFHVQAWLLVGSWVVLQFYDLLFVAQTHVAFVAHVGGIVAGLAWAPLFKRPALTAKRERPPSSTGGLNQG